MKTSVRIGAFEIDDGELHGESPGDRTLTIPCKSDPDLSGYSPVVKSLLNLTVRHHTSGMKCSRWYFLFATWMAVVKILLWMSTTRNSSVFIL